jgi:hypothetical protein
LVGATLSRKPIDALVRGSDFFLYALSFVERLALSRSFAAMPFAVMNVLP